MSIYTSLSKPGKKFALLIDPDSYTVHALIATIYAAEESGINIILVGGSMVSEGVDATIEIIRKHTSIPIVLFPGSLLQLSNKADGVLLLSLISGRNPEFLIGNHVLAATYLKNSGMELLPTGYILVGTGRASSVEYISNTRPIPSDKPDLVVATAIAGEQIGNKLIYLEAGSGSGEPVSADIIREVKRNISVPLIVGGGLCKPGQIRQVCDAGADMVVVGNAVERNAEKLGSLVRALYE